MHEQHATIATMTKKLRVTLDENTDAGRLGLELLGVRAALATARERGDDVQDLQERERRLTRDLLSHVTEIDFLSGVGRVRQRLVVAAKGECHA